MAKRPTPAAARRQTPRAPAPKPAAAEAPAPAATPRRQSAPRDPAKPATAQTTVGIKVRATQLGYYDHVRRREGDVFLIAKERDFSDRWMEYVDARTPESVSTSADELRRKHDEIIRSRRPGVLTEDNPLDA